MCRALRFVFDVPVLAFKGLGLRGLGVKTLRA